MNSKIKFKLATCAFETENEDERMPTVFWVYSPFLYGTHVLPQLTGYEAMTYNEEDMEDFVTKCINSDDEITNKQLALWEKLHKNAWVDSNKVIQVKRDEFEDLFIALARYTATIYTDKMHKSSLALLSDVLEYSSVNRNISTKDCGSAYWAGYAWLMAIRKIAATKPKKRKVPAVQPFTNCYKKRKDINEGFPVRRAPIQLMMRTTTPFKSQMDCVNVSMIATSDPNALVLRAATITELLRCAQACQNKTVRLIFSPYQTQMAFMFCLLAFHQDITSLRQDFFDMLSEGPKQEHWHGCPWTAPQVATALAKSVATKTKQENVMLSPKQATCYCLGSVKIEEGGLNNAKRARIHEKLSETL